MADRVTIWRFFHRANHALLGDGQRLRIVGWTEEQMRDGAELDVLAKEENQVVRVAYVFHSETEDPKLLVSPYRESLGFVPESSEFETLLRSEIVPKGARDDWFDVFCGTCRPDDSIYVLSPDSDENRKKFRGDSSEILFV